MPNHRCRLCGYTWFSPTNPGWCPSCSGGSVENDVGGGGGGGCFMLVLALLIPLAAVSAAMAF